jgi:Flp pilus assembly pilin Flp
LIAVVIIAAVVLVGRQVQDDFECTYDAIYAAPYGCPSG